jgi:succinate dehydrogenase / fumarate reductase cytochrome b subunit
MDWMTGILKSSIGRKTVMAISGLLLALFLFTHLAGNATAFWGREAFNSYAAHLHSLGPLIPILETGLLIIFSLHVFFGLALFFENLEARPNRYEVNANAGDWTFPARTMPYTGLLILVFIFHHLARFHFGDYNTVSDLVREYLSRPVSGLFYIFCLVALTIHISHGFWSFFQTLGLNHPKYDRMIRLITLLVSLLTGATFIMIPILAMSWPEFLK